MTIRPDLAPLLAAARTEAKRWAANGPNLLLLALVVARRHESEFRAAFGERGKSDVERRLSTGGAPADEPAVVALLEEASTAGGLDAVVQGLHQALVTADQNLPAAPGAPKPPNSPVAPVDDGLDLDPRVKDLLRLVAPGPGPGTAGREDVVDDVLSVIGRNDPRFALITGAPGSGRTVVARALANRLGAPDYKGPLSGHRVLIADAGPVIEEGRGRALRWIFDAVEDRDDTVLVLDDVDVVAALGTNGAVIEVLGLLRTADGGGRLRAVMTMTSTAAGRLDIIDADLGARLHRVPLPALSASVVQDAAAAAAAELASTHGVAIPEAVVQLSTVPPRGHEAWAQPGLAVRRLDAACVRARLRGNSEVREADLGMTTESPVAPLASAELYNRLRKRVIGQDSAVQAVSQRLALTRAGLDLRPERPDGAFLLVGPTGVGKTELAKAACEELFGDQQRLIRLDMSEYAHDWALSRLIGPQPGFVGSTEPESWLTTRVRKQPDTVVLLDEIEKAHPTVWNAFLQVLDVGRLSDSRGEVTDFSKTVVIMTSNLGAGAFSAKSVGFKSEDAGKEQAETRVLDAVKSAMAPELVNRLDAVVVFRPLEAETMFDIAAKEVGQLLDRLSGRGYRLTVGDDVLQHLANTGYDPAYGARHLQRNLERLLLQPLAEREERSLSAQLRGDEIHWVNA